MIFDELAYLHNRIQPRPNFLLCLQIVEVVCCKLTPLQSELYNHFVHSKNVISHLYLITFGDVHKSMTIGT